MNCVVVLVLFRWWGVKCNGRVVSLILVRVICGYCVFFIMKKLCFFMWMIVRVFIIVLVVMLKVMFLNLFKKLRMLVLWRL